MRFWLQSVSRLTSAAWEDAAQQALLQLLQLALDVYGAVVEQRWVKTKLCCVRHDCVLAGKL